MSRFRRLLIAYAILIASACQDPSGPLEIPSTYVARTIDGTALPATFIHGDATDVALLADTIRLYPLGVSDRFSVFRYTTIGGPVTVDTSRYQEPYTVRGDSLLFHRSCPPNALCAAPPVGIFSSDRRTMLLMWWPSGPRARYDRVSP